MIWAGHDREGLEWADRVAGAQGILPAWRVRALSALRLVANSRTGNLETARRIAKELNDQYPLATWRGAAPDDPDSETDREQVRSYSEALKTAGMAGSRAILCFSRTASSAPHCAQFRRLRPPAT